MLEIRNLYCSVGSARILNGVTLSVLLTERVGLIGPNGSGKTTLFNCISGFVSSSHGHIFFKERDISGLPPYRRARLGLGRVFQNFGIFREMSVVENVVTAIEGSEGASLLPWTSGHRARVARVREYLDMVGLGEKSAYKAGSLSGGQMRLLEIARAIAFQAELFLLDEPTAGVSPKMKGEIKVVLDTLKEIDKTVLIIEHDMNFVQDLCDRIVVLDGGRNVLEGPPEQVRANDKLQEIYFGTHAPAGSRGSAVNAPHQLSGSAVGNTAPAPR